MVTVPFDATEELWTDTSSAGYCQYRVQLFPSEQFREVMEDSTPFATAMIVACVFVGIIIAFFTYDTYVSRRNSKVMAAAAKTSKIVRSLFPSTVRAQLLGKPEEGVPESRPNSERKERVKSILHEAFVINKSTDESDESLKSKPIAELFPDCTVMFGDIAGFTAWSSVREPVQVFILLENLFRRFDE